MPSPFPGMDPFLESPAWFPCLHNSLIILFMESLQTRLPETYYAQSSQRVWLEYTHRHVEPDGELVRWSRGPRRRNRGGVVALAEVRTKVPVVVHVETIEHGPYKELYLE